MPALPPIITTARLLSILNDGADKPISRSALHEWLTTDPNWRRCIVRSTTRKYWLSTSRLQDAGILPRPEAAPVAAMPGPSFACDLKALA